MKGNTLQRLGAEKKRDRTGGGPASPSGAPGPDRFVFGYGGEYAVRVAFTIEERLQAWRLVYRKYRERQYAEPNMDGLWYSLYDALPGTTTFLVTRGDEVAATVTLVPDSPLGLPADTLYRPELDQLRRRNRRLCEIVSLVSDETSRRRCVEVLRNMFKLAYLAAYKLDGATDFVITVNPHHTGYYEKKMLFERAGQERSYAKVGGAPAVLLRLNLVTARDRYEQTLGSAVVHKFEDARQDSRWLDMMARQRVGLTEHDVETWFVRRRPLLANTHPADREYVLSFYSTSLARRLDTIRNPLPCMESPALESAVA